MSQISSRRSDADNRPWSITMASGVQCFATMRNAKSRSSNSGEATGSGPRSLVAAAM